jgi:alanine dehydrogenase
MSIAITPFTKQQLLPQEEKLEVSRRKANFLLVFPKKPVIKNDVSVLLRRR